MKSIGGYFELECGKNPQYHPEAWRLNSGCAALACIIRSFGIKYLHVPDFTCPSVLETIRKEHCECLFYDVDSGFLPKDDFPDQDFVLYNNYFGISSRQVHLLAERYPKLIVDNAQAFYMPFCGFASFYSPRKFFGLPDGGLVYAREPLIMPEDRSVSWDICSHLLRRHDLGASEGYSDFRINSQKLNQDPPLRMSFLTEALMGNIDYESAKKKRLDNFALLHSHLKERNLLKFELGSEDVPMVYPFLTDMPDLRQKLIDRKIFVASYWPGVKSELVKIIPLPIDQRYGKSEMEYIGTVICNMMSI